jgi:CRISPR/Cas system-associated protein Cas7 (RAMP superfamily)
MSGNGTNLTHVAGTFLIHADGAFLNGAGIDPRREDQNTTIPKSYRDGVGNRVPYVSAQAWRRWLKNTLIEETGWPASELRAIDLSEKGTTNKIAGELNPIDFAEDDIFGYMRAAKGQGRESAADTDDEGKTESELQRDDEVKFFRKITNDIKSVETGKRGRANKTDDATDDAQKNVSDPPGKQGKKAQDLSEEERLKLLTKVVGDLQKEAEKRVALDEEALDQQLRGRLKELPELLQKAHDFKSVWPKLRDRVIELLQVFNPGRLKALMRASPFSSSLLVSIRRKGWEGLDKGFVHLKEGTPLPYNTEFYNTDLQGVFCLDYGRLGIFWNLGDRIELDEDKIEGLLATGKITVAKDYGKRGKIFQMKDAETVRKSRAGELLKALALLRGGAKQAQFGTDVSPKALIVAGLSCGNPIFNYLFRDGDGSPEFKVDAFKELIQDYADRIVTPVLVGIRSGYLKNDAGVRELNGWWKLPISSGDKPTKDKPTEGTVIEIIVTTPLDVARKMGELLP